LIYLKIPADEIKGGAQKQSGRKQENGGSEQPEEHVGKMGAEPADEIVDRFFRRDEMAERGVPRGIGKKAQK